ncbi:MAG: lytic transglycosylase domain-containing protein [Rhodanobacter sp.]
MFDVAQLGGSVDRPAGGFPLSLILLGLILAGVVLCCALWSPVARAGALYQCIGASGEAVFSSSKAGYHDCKVISTYAEPVPRRLPSRPPPPKPSLTGVTGSVETNAWKLAVDGSIPIALDRVVGSVESSGRRLGDAQMRRESMAAVKGSAETSAPLPLASAAAGTPGQWNYHESHQSPEVKAAAAASGSRVLRGAVYRIVRKDGSVEYTNLRAASSKGQAVTMLFSYIATCVACDLHSKVRWGSVSLNLTAYADIIRSASIEYGVDQAFLRAIIHAESAFNPRALSLKGAQGLMQLMPGTASDMGVLDAFDSDQNIRGGARYLSLLLRDFDGNERLAAAAYNAGPGAVQRYKGVPPYAETQVYVERVGTLRKRYGEASHPPLALSGPG